MVVSGMVMIVISSSFREHEQNSGEKRLIKIGSGMQKCLINYMQKDGVFALCGNVR